MTTPLPPMPDKALIDDVANVIHAWSCPLCPLDPAAMVDSGQAHVTESDRMFAGFLISALGLSRREPASDPL